MKKWKNSSTDTDAGDDANLQIISLKDLQIRIGSPFVNQSAIISYTNGTL